MTFPWKFYVIFVPERHFCGVSRAEQHADDAMTAGEWRKDDVEARLDDAMLPAIDMWTYYSC
jgi:hypothetical protein